MDNIEKQNEQSVDNTASEDIFVKEEVNGSGDEPKSNSGSSKIALIISVVALVVSLVLLIILLGNKSGDDSASLAGNSNVISGNSGIESSYSGNLTVAYVDTEKLLLEYKYSVKLNEDLLTEQAKARASFESKYRQFEKKYNDFMEKARLGSFLSQSSMETQQNELLQEQQRLAQTEEELTQKLMEKQATLNKELLDTLTNFLDDYNRDKRYSLILNNAVILQGDPGMDITDDVILKLNARYENTIAK